MSNYIYKCVSVPTIINTGKTGKNIHENAVKVYENIINNVAKDGWEFVNIDTVSSLQNPGCLGQIIGLFLGGAKSEIETFKLLTFKKLTNNNISKTITDIVSSNNSNICNKCNNTVKEEDMFCENCGNKLK